MTLGRAREAESNCRRLAACLILVIGQATFGSRGSFAQSLPSPLPASPGGYDDQLGVTVQSRLRPENDPAGVQVGTFLIRPQIDETFGYNSNPTGSSGGGSPVQQVSGSVSATSLWSRHSLWAATGVDQYDFLSIAGLDFTDWHAAIGGGYTLGENQITAGYTHQTYHQFGTTIGTIRSVTPVGNDLDTARLGYAYTFNRLTLTPDLTISSYRFGPATVGGTQVDQSFLDRTVFAARLTAAYSLSAQGNIVVQAAGIRSDFPYTQPGQPSNSSTSALLLAGLDYQLTGPWRFQLLAGVQSRWFSATQYATRVTPIVEGNATWTPTGVLTVKGEISRSIDDPQSGGTIGFVLTQLDLRADYELRRDILLHARSTVQYAQFIGQGSQTSIGGGASVDYLLNRHVRLTLSGNYIKQTGASIATATTTDPSAIRLGAFSQGIIALGLHLAL